MSEKILLLAILPVVTLVITLGWLWLLTTGQRSISLSLKGLGLEIKLSSSKNGEAKDVNTFDIPGPR